MTRKLVFGLATMAFVLFVSTASANAQEPGSWQAAAAKKLETLLVGAQKICPVMGKDLTKMGGPVKATMGEQTVFLCCKGCFQGTIEKQHWDQIQTNLMAAQGKCPVMGKPLPKSATSIVVNGRKVFVCCPPCTNEIKGDPNKYLAVLDGFLAVNLTRQTEQRGIGGQPDHPKAAVKQIYTCPMHPEIQWIRPDKCPICDMKLVVKGAKTPTAMQEMHDHSEMSRHADEMQHDHQGMESMMLGCGCSMYMDMMGMGGTNGNPARAVSPTSRSGRSMYRSYSARRGTGRCGC